MAKPTVAVLLGGRSSEHEISCLTAGGVLGAINRDHWNVVAVGISREGRWSEVDADPDAWQVVGEVLPTVPDTGDEVLLPARAGDSTWRIIRGGKVHDFADIDVVFPVLHGPWGEDGTVQGALEMWGITYVGAGVLASAVGMDKHFAKELFRAAGLPVAPGVNLSAGEDVGSYRTSIEQWGMPVFVKPARAGSSAGVSRASSWEEVREAVVAARVHDPKVVIEAEIRGREVECAVLAEGDTVRASIPGEIVVSGEGHQFYDFDAKYRETGSVQLMCPAELDQDIADQIQEYAKRAFRAIGAEGLARVDFFVGDDGAVTLNEINTMPGFTPRSMYPRMWQSQGVEYAELVEILLQGARARSTGLR